MSINYRQDYVYARRSLVESYVRYEDDIVFVEDIDENTGQCRITSISGKNPVTCSIESLNLKPIPLGYINERGTAKYVYRVPSRQWRQGITTRTVHTKGGPIRISRSFLQPMQNNYPSFNEAKHALSTGVVESMALNPEFCICMGNNNSFTVLYKETTVGVVDKDSNKIVLKNKFKYLKEFAKEVLKDVLTD